jgi:hypothetical protein
LTRTNCSTCSPFMGTLWELNFYAINQIMHLSRWEMVSKLNWQYTFWRFVSCPPCWIFIVILEFCDELTLDDKWLLFAEFVIAVPSDLSLYILFQ